MTREEFESKLIYCSFRYSSLQDKFKAMSNLKSKFIKSLEATIEAQEIIIKDKTAIMDSMAQPKTCDSCEHKIYHTRDNFHNVTIYKCKIRDQFHFNGSCDGLVCDKYEPKAQP